MYSMRQVSRSVASLVPVWGARESSGPYILYKALPCFSLVDAALSVGPWTLLQPAPTFILHLVERGGYLITSSTCIQPIDPLPTYTTAILRCLSRGLHRLLVPYSRFALIGPLVAIRSFAYLLHAIIIHRPAQSGTGRPVIPNTIHLRPSSWANREPRTWNVTSPHLISPHLTLFHPYLRLAARLRILETPKFRSNPISSVVKRSFSGGHIITGF